ncbi:MgtC/SapB family protein [Tabrizicola sp. BL-A-41-H6]|uniref:MgtC/SapB family protein n=1 Tax=Tabrizicola sp. BL-A-41-H6 TaxID=3421107 RepID=UPI003D67E47B
MPEFSDFLAILNNSDITVPLGLSLLTGAVIGGEREVQGKPAGLRTHMLVCLASTLLMLVATRQSEWVMTQIPGTSIVADLTRMPHGILTGIGFLGAGVIMRNGVSVHGLTTAASLWVTAALGIVYGVGMVSLGVIGSVIALLVLGLLKLLQTFIPVRMKVRVVVRVREGAAFGASDLESLLRNHGLSVREVSWRHFGAHTATELAVSAYTRSTRSHLEALVQALRGVDGVTDFTVRPLDGPAHEG